MLGMGLVAAFSAYQVYSLSKTMEQQTQHLHQLTEATKNDSAKQPKKEETQDVNNAL
jgi:hypothetical protein